MEVGMIRLLNMSFEEDAKELCVCFVDGSSFSFFVSGQYFLSFVFIPGKSKTGETGDPLSGNTGD